MYVEFFGVRGSVASAGETTRRYGGNTSCVLVEADDRVLVLDAGTGIRPLGDRLLQERGPGQVRVDLLLSHLHWDHIQGFPFFAPAYVPGDAITVHHVRVPGSAPGDSSARSVFETQMRAPTFPVGLDMMRAELAFAEHDGHEVLQLGPVTVRWAAVDHPNGCVAYRVEHQGRAMVYATDLEHGEAPSPSLVELARGANLLVYDAMYTPEEYRGEVGPPRHGWGHSTYEEGARLAEAAGVERLCLFHHDPSHDDVFMDGLAARARDRFADTLVAREGLRLSA